MRFIKYCVWVLSWSVCPLLVNAQDNPFPVWHLLRVVADPAADLTPEQAWKKSLSADAMLLSQPHQVLASANNSPHWAAWTVPKEYAQQLPLWVSLQSPTQDHAELWLRFNGGAWQRQAALHETTNLGWGSGQLFFTWPLYDTTYRQVDVLVRIHGLNRVQFPIAMQKPQAFMQQHLKLCLLMGSILAVPLLVVIYSLTFLPVLKSNTLLLFNALAVLELTAGFWISGLMHLLWPSLDRQYVSWVGVTAYGLLLGVSIYHAQSFMKTATHYPRLHDGLSKLVNAWWMVFLMCCWVWPKQIRFVLLLGGSAHAVVMLLISAWFYQRQPSLKRGVFCAVWVVYLLGMLVYWLFRYLEWPLFITLGTHFVQGALVATLLGWSACMQVLKERDTLRRDMQLARDRSRWFAAAHHDLWQPIQSMLLYARALVLAPDQQRPRLLWGMQLASRSVDDFMGHLRFWAEGEHDARSVQSSTTCLPVHELLGPLVDEMRLLAEQKHIYLRYQASRYRVKVEVHQVERMVRNLLTNALRYTQASGRVLIGCRRQADALWIWCMDTGVGMSEAQLSESFDAFTQFDKGAEQLRTLGLGLYSFQKNAQRLGLKTRWHSTPGKGTMIGFAVPLA